VALFATSSGFLANLFLSADEGAPEHNAVDSESDVQATLQHVERLHRSNKPPSTNFELRSPSTTLRSGAP